MRRRRRKPRRIRKRQWVGSAENSRAVVALFTPYLFVSFYRHNEPFAKRDRSRRREKTEKRLRREEAYREAVRVLVEKTYRNFMD